MGSPRLGNFIINTFRNRIIYDIGKTGSKYDNELFEKLRADGVQENDYLRIFQPKSDTEPTIAWSSDKGGAWFNDDSDTSSDDGQARRWQNKLCKDVNAG